MSVFNIANPKGLVQANIHQFFTKFVSYSDQHLELFELVPFSQWIRKLGKKPQSLTISEFGQGAIPISLYLGTGGDS